MPWLNLIVYVLADFLPAIFVTFSPPTFGVVFSFTYFHFSLILNGFNISHYQAGKKKENLVTLDMELKSRQMEVISKPIFFSAACLGKMSLSPISIFLPHSSLAQYLSSSPSLVHTHTQYPIFWQPQHILNNNFSLSPHISWQIFKKNLRFIKMAVWKRKTHTPINMIYINWCVGLKKG